MSAELWVAVYLFSLEAADNGWDVYFSSRIDGALLPCVCGEP